MKKTLSLLLALILVTALVPVNTTAAQDTGVLSITGQDKAALGATLTLTLSLAENPGLCALGVEIQYDAQVLELLEVKTEELIGQTAPRDNTAAPYPLTWIDGQSQSNNTKVGTLCSLTFRVREDGFSFSQTTVRVSCTSAYDTNYEPVTVTAAEATINLIPVLIGDLNEDGALTGADAVYLLYRIALGDAAYPTNQPCDFNRDGTLTTKDALYLAYHTVFGQELYPL